MCRPPPCWYTSAKGSGYSIRPGAAAATLEHGRCIITGALFIIVLIVSFTMVRIGAIAFQLTGLEWSLAKFQALSCFTGTGFTTREAELVTGSAQRRRIASILKVLGNVGLVLMIATVAQ